MVNDKLAASQHPGAPVVATHTVILYEAVCHSCGWASGSLERLVDADREADEHRCLLERRDTR